MGFTRHRQLQKNINGMVNNAKAESPGLSRGLGWLEFLKRVMLEGSAAFSPLAFDHMTPSSLFSCSCLQVIYILIVSVLA